MRYSTKAWISLGIHILAIEVMAPPGMLLSNEMDRWRQHPVGRILATAGILITASHLMRLLDPRVDPFALAFQWKVDVAINEILDT